MHWLITEQRHLIAHRRWAGTVTVGGNLAATTDAANGVINLGTLAVDGTVQLTTNGSGDATVVNDAGLNFAASTVGGNLAATATTGNMTDSGVLNDCRHFFIHNEC